MKTRQAVVLVTSAILLASPALAIPQMGDPVPKEQSEDPTYGYTEENPVRVGGGARNHEPFLKSLRGPDGQKLKYKRLGSCCFFSTPNTFMGDKGLLDKYEVSYKGLKEPLTLYLNSYDYEQPMVPVGLTLAK